MTLRLAWTTYQDLVSKKQNKTKSKEKENIFLKLLSPYNLHVLHILCLTSYDYKLSVICFCISLQPSMLLLNKAAGILSTLCNNQIFPLYLVILLTFKDRNFKNLFLILFSLLLLFYL
jgi:hypothetical protein